MDYNNFGGTYYIRMDRGDEVIAGILAVCEKEGIESATFSGIGGCSDAYLQTFIPEQGAFETAHITGALEMVSLLGNVVPDDSGRRFFHAHALFTDRDGDKHRTHGGHLKSTTVLYTAEIELRPVMGGSIGRVFDPETGTGFWKLR